MADAKNETREERLAKALRANLARRKARDRAEAKQDPSPLEGEGGAREAGG